MGRGQGRCKDLKNPDHRSGLLLKKKPNRLFHVIGGIYVNISRITIQVGRGDRPFDVTQGHEPVENPELVEVVE